MTHRNNIATYKLSAFGREAFFVSRLYITAQEASDFLSLGAKGSNMMRLYIFLRGAKWYSGNYHNYNKQTALQRRYAASVLGMGVRAWDENIRRLIAAEWLLPKEGGGWKVRSYNNQYENNFSTRRKTIYFKNIKTQVAATDYLYLANTHFVKDTYKRTDSVKPNATYIPTKIREESSFFEAIINTGRVAYFGGSNRKCIGVKDYCPVAGSYLASMFSKSATTIRERRKANKKHYRRTHWYIPVASAGEAICMYNNLVDYFNNSIGIYKGKSDIGHYVSFDMPSHFSVKDDIKKTSLRGDVLAIKAAKKAKYKEEDSITYKNAKWMNKEVKELKSFIGKKKRFSIKDYYSLSI